MNIEKQSEKQTRDTFGSKWGFIMACIGSAVGMGNIWLFPYRVGQYGGAAFLIPYILFIVIIGFTGVIGEMAFGRAMESGPLGAFRKAMERKGKSGRLGELIGLIPVIGSLGIAIGYSIVVGWILCYFVGSMEGSAFHAVESSSYFGNISGSFGSVSWHLSALFLAYAIMISGVSAGIEKVNKILMPLFFLMFLILAIRILALPGSMDGYRYLLQPDWSLLAQPKTWVYALGQAFFSLSLAGSGTLVYGSYLKKSVDIVDSARNVAIFDTIASLLASFVIIPAVFIFGLDPSSGPSLMFITMPEVFKGIPGGQFFMILFFAAVLFAGMTSLVNLFEAPIEALQNKFGFSRMSAVLSVGTISAIIGICVEGIVGSWMDIVSIYIIPLGALLAAIMFFWVCGSSFARNEVQAGRKKTIGKWFEPMSKYVFCGLTIIVYILGIFYGGIG